MTKLNERIKNARKQLYLSQEYVANFLGVNRNAIIEIESGKRKVSAEELGKFSELFHITTDELLHGNNDYTSGQIFIKNFELLDENDQKEILNLIEFKRIMKERKNWGDTEYLICRYGAILQFNNMNSFIKEF